MCAQPDCEVFVIVSQETKPYCIPLRLSLNFSLVASYLLEPIFGNTVDSALYAPGWIFAIPDLTFQVP
jgi:hypothetical protein